MDALQYLKEKYEIEGNTHYFREPDLPISTSLEKVCNYMQEYSDQQNAELRERVKELEAAISGYKECFEQFIPESKWDEATAFLSSYGNGLAKDFQLKENQ